MSGTWIGSCSEWRQVIVLRMEVTTSTILPIAMNLAIRTPYNIMIHIGLNSCQNLLECLQCHSYTHVRKLDLLHLGFTIGTFMFLCFFTISLCFPY